MSELSKEHNSKLRELREELVCWQGYYDPVDDKEQHEMFVLAADAVAELLALRERAEPMFYVDGNAAKRLLRGYTRFATMTVEPKSGLSLPLYIEPPPAPVVVPDFKKLSRALVENLVDCDAADDSAMKQYLKWTEKTLRAAMLAAAPGKEG